MARASVKKRRLKAAGWSPKAKALRFGDYLGVIRFRESEWWHIDMTGARVGPISRREAYLTAVSYMNAAEIAGFGAEDLRLELLNDCAQSNGSATANQPRADADGGK